MVDQEGQVEGIMLAIQEPAMVGQEKAMVGLGKAMVGLEKAMVGHGTVTPPQPQPQPQSVRTALGVMGPVRIQQLLLQLIHLRPLQVVLGMGRVSSVASKGI